MGLPDASSIQSLNRIGLQNARQCVEPSSDTLGFAHEFGDPLLIAESLLVQLAWATIRGRFAEAEAFASEILLVVGNDVQQLDPIFEWTFFHARGIAATNCLDYSQAESFFRHSLHLADSMNDSSARTSGLLNMGRMFHRQGRISEAVEVLAQVADNQETPSHLEALHAGHLAEMFENQGHLEEALKYRQAALSHDPMLRLRERALCQAALARILTRLERFDDAQESANAARQYSDEMSWSFVTAIVDHTDALLLTQQNELAAAERLARKALDTFRSNRIIYEEMNSLALLGRLSLLAGDPLQALSRVEHPEFDKMGPHVRGRISQLRVDAHRDLGNWEQVVVHQDDIQRHEVELQRDVTGLYSLLNRHQEGEILRSQRQQLADAGQALQAAHHEKDELLNIVAHDLNSPLTALDLTLSFLAADPDIDPLARIRTAAETSRRVQGIINQLSTLNDLESGSVEFNIVATPLLPVLSRVVREYESAARAKQIELDLVIIESEAQAHLVMADRGRLQQVLANLISNSLKYSRAQTRVELRCTQLIASPLDPAGRSFAQISVQDEGLGLSASDLRGLFLKYSRLSARPTAEESSSGIGLYIARSFARSMGGDITAFSAGKGLGSTFSVTIPLAEQQPKAASD